MKPPVALFKKKVMKLYLFLKTKSQVKAYQHSQLYVVCLSKWKDVKKNVKKKLGESFLELIYFIFHMSFKNNTSFRLCVCIICSLLFTYALLEAFIEKCLLNRCLFKLAKSLKNTCESIYCCYCRL